MNDPDPGKQDACPEVPRPVAPPTGRKDPQPSGTGWLVFKIIVWIVGGLAVLALLAIGLLLGTCFLGR